MVCAKEGKARSLDEVRSHPVRKKAARLRAQAEGAMGGLEAQIAAVNTTKHAMKERFMGTPPQIIARGCKGNAYVLLDEVPVGITFVNWRYRTGSLVEWDVLPVTVLVRKARTETTIWEYKFFFLFL